MNERNICREKMLDSFMYVLHKSAMQFYIFKKVLFSKSCLSLLRVRKVRYLYRKKREVFSSLIFPELFLLILYKNMKTVSPHDQILF